VTALETAARCITDAGAPVRVAAMHKLFAELAGAHKDIQYSEMAGALGFEMLRYPHLLSSTLRESIEYGMRCTPEVYDSKKAIAAQCGTLIDSVFAEFDVLLAPSAPGEAPEGLENTGSPVFNRGWTLLGLPCVTVPAFNGPRGLPVGIQVVGRFRHDARTLACAHWIQQRMGGQHESIGLT
jgi:Asp-tRNA(Asn)/Glu-tRNA(Gln) amidotransferase A subunit family amidase